LFWPKCSGFHSAVVMFTKEVSRIIWIEFRWSAEKPSLLRKYSSSGRPCKPFRSTQLNLDRSNLFLRSRFGLQNSPVKFQLMDVDILCLYLTNTRSGIFSEMISFGNWQLFREISRNELSRYLDRNWVTISLTWGSKDSSMTCPLLVACTEMEQLQKSNQGTALDGKLGFRKH
jgi:hypothetical protein